MADGSWTRLGGELIRRDPLDLLERLKPAPRAVQIVCQQHPVLELFQTQLQPTAFTRTSRQSTRRLRKHCYEITIHIRQPERRQHAEEPDSNQSNLENEPRWQFFSASSYWVWRNPGGNRTTVFEH